MKSKQKFLYIGSAASMGLYALFPLVCAPLLLNGVLLDGETRYTLFFLLAAGLSSAVGTVIGRKSDCPIILIALCTGLVPQVLLMLAGCFAFPNGFTFTAHRWTVPVFSFVIAIVTGLTGQGRERRKRKRKAGKKGYRTK